MPKTIVVSIIEDNRFIRSGWEAVLKEAPEFSVRGSFGSCEDAFASEALAESDVVLMDIGLPGMTGIEGVKEIRRKYPKLLAIMCTVYDDDQNVFDAICAGATGYLLKKASPVELLQAFHDAVAGGSPMTPTIARKVISSFQKPFQAPSLPEDSLTEREQEILSKMAIGKSYASIAEELFLSLDGVRYHIRHIYEKLQVHSRSEAISKGYKDRLIQPPR